MSRYKIFKQGHLLSDQCHAVEVYHCYATHCPRYVLQPLERRMMISVRAWHKGIKLTGLSFEQALDRVEAEVGYGARFDIESEFGDRLTDIPGRFVAQNGDEYSFSRTDW